MPFLFFILMLASSCTHQKGVRDSGEIETRLRAVSGAEFKTVGVVNYSGREYPLYSLIYPARGSKNDNRKNVFLSGSVHGDEPVGTHALLEFLEKIAPAYAKDYRFFVLPLVNPIGFERNTLENAQKENINRQFFIGSKCPEAQLVIHTLKDWNVRFAFAIDMHEIPPYWEDEGFKKSDNPREAYLYETQLDKKRRIGRKMMESLPREIEVCQWPQIYGDKADRGLVSYPEGNGNPVYAKGTTLDAFILKHYSDHTFTAETPIGWPLEKRIRTQLSWLTTALQQPF